MFKYKAVDFSFLYYIEKFHNIMLPPQRHQNLDFAIDFSKFD